MKRDTAIEAMSEPGRLWDVIIVGGGASGLGAALEAASRGHLTLLLEQHDFTKGTSSRSTKLVHGGVRYLKQGRLALVREALRERGLLLGNAPHLVRRLAFVIPVYKRFDAAFYGIGLKLYDRLAGRLGLGPSRVLSAQETVDRLPTVETDGLVNGVLYYDAQFDDSRLGVHLAMTAHDHGATLLNYCKATGLLKGGGRITGVQVRDEEGGTEYEVFGKSVINATGVFADALMRMDDPDHHPLIAPSQGMHLVLPQAFLPGECALMVPKTRDGRVLFGLPWQGRVLVGTTDTPVQAASLEPQALEEEIGFVLEHARRYLSKDPEPSDVLSVFAGLRPLIGASRGDSTASLSRDHAVLTSKSGLITVAGGKWTTYRKMGEDVIDRAEAAAGLTPRPSRSRQLRIHGWTPPDMLDQSHLSVYGSDGQEIERLIEADSGLGDRLHPRLPYLKAQVVWAARQEMARTVEDVLARRTRALLLDAQASIECAGRVADLLSTELGRSSGWAEQQTRTYATLAEKYRT